MSGMKTCAFLRLPHHTQTGPLLSSPAPSWTLGLCCDSASRTTSPESQTSGGTRTTNSHRNDRASRRRARRRGETLPSSVAIETVRMPEDTWQKCAEVLFVVCLSCVSLMAAFRTHFNVYCCICFFYCEQMLKCPFQHRNDP